MKSFDETTLPTLPLTHALMRSVGRLHKYRGREQLYAQQARQALDELKEKGKIEAEGRGPAAVWRKLDV